MLIIIIGGLLLLTSIIAFIMGANSNKEPKQETPKEEEPITTPILNKEISRLNDSNKFFAIQDAVNNFYTELFTNKEEALLLVDKNYVSKNNIDINNINEFFKINNENVNFIGEEIYYNIDSNMTYYFIKGYNTNIDELKYTDNIYYLLKVDMDNNYSNMPLDDVENLEEYANEYYLKNIYIDNTSIFKINDILDVNKIVTYISIFKNLMDLNISKAFNMINDETKKLYSTQLDFENDRTNITNKLFTKFKSINVEYQDNIIIYKVQNYNGDTIIITEMFPNDFKIDFNFLELSE